MGLTGDPLLLFLVPGIVGVVFVVLFVTLVREEDSRQLPLERIGFAGVLAKYLYNPRKYPDFSWNWLGRFLFYFGLTLNTTFTAYFFAERLGRLDHRGFRDHRNPRCRRSARHDRWCDRGWFSVRSPAEAPSVPRDRRCDHGNGHGHHGALVRSPRAVRRSLIVSLGIGLFSAVDMALLLDVLPEKQTDAGRFMGITGFATSIPQAAAPFIASGILLIGVTGTAKNYSLLFFIAAALVLLGGLVILRIKSVR